MKYYGMTDKGKVRATNQDNYVIARNQNGDIFAIVCDGIGGNKGGDVASRMVVNYFSIAFSETEAFTSSDEAKEFINTGVKEINRQIFEAGKQREDLRGMGTTLVGAMITKVGMFIVNVGDSRAYGYDENGFRHLTIDHSLVNDMIMHGELTREQAKDFPRRNVLTNAIGVWETVRCDVDTHHEHFRSILLCSDGLHSYVDEKKIRQIVAGKTNDPSLRARRLMKAALDAGGFDNVTVVLITMEEGDYYG